MSDAVASLFIFTGTGFCLVGMWRSLRRELATALLLIAIGAGMCLIASIILDELASAGFDAAILALAIWLWWNSGGGQGPRRRLRRWADNLLTIRRPLASGTLT